MALLTPARISGLGLKALVALASSPARSALAAMFRKDLGIDAVRALEAEVTAPLPQSFFPISARRERPSREARLGPLPIATGVASLRSYHEQYRTRRLSPVDVVERLLVAERRLAEQSPKATPFSFVSPEALSAARASADRLARGTPRSELDGIVVPIKEELRVEGFPSRLGSGSMPAGFSTADATSVARLRAAGAMLVGETLMTEFGLSPLGINPYYSMPRNPWDRTRLAGGSSTGSAVAVALGLAPLALGCDGGGSIRVPAAFCGLFGLKPTYGRIPLSGQVSAAGNSVTHVGALASSMYDLACFLQHTEGPCPLDPRSQQAPAFSERELMRALEHGVQGLRIGIDEGEWSAAPTDITRPLHDALLALEKEGAVLVTTKSRLAQHASALGYMTIAIEGSSALIKERQDLKSLSLDLQLLLQVVSAFEPDDYALAQRVRGALRQEMAELLAGVDLIAMPGAAGAPPQATDKELASGFVDPVALDQASRFAYVGNLCGLPAGVAPVGRDQHMMPVGLQLVGDAWDDAGVVSALSHLERIGVARVERPSAYHDLLS